MEWLDTHNLEMHHYRLQSERCGKLKPNSCSPFLIFLEPKLFYTEVLGLGLSITGEIESHYRCVIQAPLSHYV